MLCLIRLAAFSSPSPTFLGIFCFCFPGFSQLFCICFLWIHHFKSVRISDIRAFLLTCHRDISNWNIFSGPQRRIASWVNGTVIIVPLKTMGEAKFYGAHSLQGVSGSAFLHPIFPPELIISEFPTCAAVPVCLVKYLHHLPLSLYFYLAFGYKTMYFLRISFQKLIVILGAPKLFPEAPDTINVSNCTVKKRLWWNLVVALHPSKAAQLT